MANPLKKESIVSDALLDQEDEQAIVSQVLSEVNNYVEGTQTQRAHWSRIYDSMEGKLRRSKAYPWSSAYHMRLLRTAVWTILPYMQGRELTFQFEPVGDEDAGIARLFSPVLGHTFNYQMNGYMKSLEALAQAVQFGTCFPSIYWKTVKDQYTGETLYDAPMIDINPIENVYVHPMIASIQELELQGLPLIRSKTVTEYDLRGQTRYDQNKIEKLIEFSGEDNQDHDLADKHSMVDTGDFENVRKLFEDHSHYMIFERETRNTIITVAASEDGAILLEKRLNPDKFIHTIDMKYELSSRPGRMYGVGIGDNGEEIEELVHDLLNQFMDSQRSDDNPMTIAEEGALKNPRDVVRRPGGVIWARNGRIDGIREIPTKGIDPRREQLLDRYMEHFKSSTGASDTLSGDLEGTDTATESDIQDRNARSRPELARQIAFKAVERMGSMTWELMKKYIHKVEAVQVWDEETEEFQKIMYLAGKKSTIIDEGRAIEIDDGRIVDENGHIFDRNKFRAHSPGVVLGLRGNYNLKIDIETTQGLNKNIVVKQLQDMLLDAANDPNSALKTDEIRKEILRLRGIPNPPRFFGERNSQLVPDIVGQLGDIEGGQSFGTAAGNTPNTANLITQRGQNQSANSI